MSYITYDKQNLTQDLVDRLTAPGRYPHSKAAGFYLNVGNSGKKSYLFVTKMPQDKDGKRENISIALGKHPETKLKDAIDGMIDCKALVKKGIHPVRKKKAEREANLIADKQAAEKQQAKSMTVQDALEKYIAYKTAAGKDKTEKKKKGKLSASTISTYRLTMGKHLKDWLERPLSEITAAECDERYREIASITLASANNAFRGLRAACNHIINYYDGAIIEKNPVRKVSWEDLEPREKKIEDRDLPTWWAANQELSNPVYSDYFAMLLLTGLRKEEAAGLVWSDVNFKGKYWIVRNTKNGRDHSLPFTKHVEQLLKRRWSNKIDGNDFVFPSQPRTDADGKITQTHIFDTRYQQQQITDACGVEFDNHMLRKTFATAATFADTPPYICDRFINHHKKSNLAQSTYTILKDLESLQEPLQKVEDRLLSLALPKTPSKNPSKITSSGKQKK